MSHRVFEIVHRTRTATARTKPVARERSKARMKQLYRELMGIARAVVRQAETVAGLGAGRARAGGKRLGEQLRTTVGLVRRVLAQTRARVLRGDTHYPDKVLSLFEAHTEAIRKGKAVKPTEFGTLVKIQEAEAQFITDYEVCPTARPRWHAVGTVLGATRGALGRPPRLAVADAGFASAAHINGGARASGPVRRAPAAAPRTAPTGLRAALRWRTGSEGRISALKRRHGLARCRYHSLLGMERWVGFEVIANNLLVLGGRARV